MMCTSEHLIPYNLNTSIVIQLLDIAHKLRTLSLHALYLEANINNADFKLFAKKPTVVSWNKRIAETFNRC